MIFKWARKVVITFIFKSYNKGQKEFRTGEQFNENAAGFVCNYGRITSTKRSDGWRRLKDLVKQMAIAIAEAK